MQELVQNIMQALSAVGEMEVLLLDEAASLPNRKREDDAGYDIAASEALTIAPRATSLVSTGIALKPPSGWYGQLKSRSGMASRGIHVTGGVIDENYRGEIKVCLVNGSDDPLEIAVGDRIAQIVFLQYGNFEVKRVDSLEESTRGLLGFGSSGK